tara:strand:- start:5835 stop:6704 length:870 start_codon:yes stop_codon:yes gene_type:complete
MKKWIQLTRPKTLLTGLAPVILAYGHLLNQEKIIDNKLCILTVICVILLQVGSNLANDLYDGIRGIDSDERLGPRRSISKGDITPKTLKVITFLVFISAFLIGTIISFYSGFEIFLIGFLSLIVAFAYTGGPYPLSYFALGELLAFIFFGSVAVCGVYFIQDKSITTHLFLASFMPGFFSAALMSLNNYRDIYTDKKTQKKTIAIYLGEVKSKYLTILFIILGTMTGYFFNSNTQISTLILPTILSILSIFFIYKTPHSEKLNKGLGLISITNFIWCLSFLLTSWITNA